MNSPPAPVMRPLHAALAVERLDFVSFAILIAIAAEQLPAQARIAHRLDLRYWTVRTHVDSSPWIIKHRLDLVRLSITPEALAMIRRIKPSISHHHQPTVKL